MPLLVCPVEIIREIANNLPARDLNSLMRTNRYLSACVVDIFYRTGVQERMDCFARYRKLYRRPRPKVREFLDARFFQNHNKRSWKNPRCRFFRLATAKFPKLLEYLCETTRPEIWFTYIDSHTLRSFARRPTGPGDMEPGITFRDNGLTDLVGSGFLVVIGKKTVKVPWLIYPVYSYHDKRFVLPLHEGASIVSILDSLERELPLKRRGYPKHTSSRFKIRRYDD